MTTRIPSALSRRVLNVAAAMLAGAVATYGGGWFDRDRPTAMADEATNMSQPVVREPTMHEPPMPEPRDPEIAVREEYDAAVRAGTVAALDLFIRRHPDHALVELARREMERLESEGAPR